MSDTTLAILSAFVASFATGIFCFRVGEHSGEIRGEVRGYKRGRAEGDDLVAVERIQAGWRSLDQRYNRAVRRRGQTQSRTT